MRKVRIAHVTDGILGLIIAVLLFPFPTIRAAVSLPVFVASILVTIVVAHLLYLAISLRIWNRTPVMYFLDLGVDPRPVGVLSAAGWALASVIAFVPGFVSDGPIDPARGWPARLSGHTTVGTVALDSSE